MSLTVKGNYDNSTVLTSIDGSKWASVQDGTALSNMKRISVDNLFTGREGLKLTPHRLLLILTLRKLAC